MTVRSLAVAALAAAALSCAPPRPRSEVDSYIAAQIGRIKAVDNHAHPPRSANDHEFDALPVEAMQPAPLPARIDPNNPEFKITTRARDAAGALDEAGIEIMLANRVAMGPGLDPTRFKWVPFADALMYPLSNESLSRRDPDRKTFFAAEEKLLRRYMGEAGAGALPLALDKYLAFVSRTVERHRQQGAVAEKFEMAYLRTLAVGSPAKADAEKVYAAFVKGGTPPDTDYKTLQDYIFRHIGTECGRLGLAVHIHTCAGAGGWFEIAGANPMNLEPLFNDTRLAKTQFVIVHGGWPWTREAAALMMKPNVWVDFSALDLLLQRRTLSQILREWLEFMPDRVLFGTDAGPWGPGIGLEQTARVASDTAREALGMAVTEMFRDGEVTREHAVDLARGVLRDNARRLYGIK